MIVAGDIAHRADAAEPVQIFDQQGPGALASRRNAGGRPAGSAADHHHVVFTHYRNSVGALGHARRLRAMVLLDRDLADDPGPR